MNRDNTLRRWFPRLMVGACSTLALSAAPALAQKREPAATLLPARPSLAPAVVRGATPDALMPSFTGAYVPSVPAPKYEGADRGDSKSWAGAKWAGLKETVVGKPNPTASKSGEPDPRLITAPTSPLIGSGVPAVQPTPPQPLQNVYASPPAYRWYGWGGTTPGANPHAPSGVYPQGSANWYSQTGATPGAFPDTGARNILEAPAIEPPVYTARPMSGIPFHGGVPAKPVETKPTARYLTEQTIPEPRVVARTPVGSGLNMPAAPSLPSGMPVAIASSNEGRALPAEPVALPVNELNWQTASGRGVPLPKAPDPQPTVSQPVSTEPAWTQPTQPVKPTVSVIRGQLDGREPQSLDTIIRSACVGRVVSAEVRAITAKKLVVTFVAASENAAREAAALVAVLPELKPYEVTFEAQIAGR